MSTTTQTIPASNDLRHQITINDGKGQTLYIKIHLNDQCNNGHQDFAITADIYQSGKPKIDKYWLMGGCCHEEILKVMPELKIFVDLHLSDYKGIPMHAVENGIYFLREGFDDVKPGDAAFKTKFCEYYRISSAQFDKLNECENKIQYALAMEELNILEQWADLANTAIAQLEEMTGKKFLVDSKRTQFNRPSNEDIEAEKLKQATGYYTTEAKEQRRKEAENKLMFDLLEEERKKIEAIREEYAIKSQVLHIGGKKALDNCIYYNHNKTLAFNWKGYESISEGLVNKIQSEIKLPEGAKFENKQK